MNFISQELEDYSLNHTEPESELLKKLSRETWVKILNPRMLSGHIQGRLLSLISKLVKPEFILEIGTYTGYSAICLAEGLVEKGKIVTIDINEELSEITSRYFKEAGISQNVEQITGNALDIIPKLNYSYDLVFIDADKENYCNYYNLLIDKVKTGGIIISDNVLWSGKVLAKEDAKDIETLGIKKFNALVASDSRVEKLLLPVRDGLMIVRKK